MNCFLVGLVVASFVALSTCDPAGVSDKCKVAYVPNANYVPHIDFVGLGGQITYYCLPDYYMEGDETLFCHPTGWKGKIPRCLPTVPKPQCKYQIKDLENGFIDAEIKDYYDDQDKIWYFCYHPYVLEGAKDVECREGHWDYPAPRCVLNEKQCLRRDPPANGAQDPDKPAYDTREKVLYSCTPPYLLTGFPKAVCIQGIWSNDVPTCEPPRCRDLQAPENGYLTPDQDEYIKGDMVTFQCFEHYQLVGFGKLTCLPNGEWNYPEPTCQEITCNPLSPPKYGSLYPEKPIYNLKDVINFECNDNFDLIGSDRVTCLENGQWSDDVPECRPQECNVPVIEYGKFTPKKPLYKVGDYVRFMCDDGFLLQGVDEIHCRAGGVWSSDFPICHPIQCDRPVFNDGTLDEDKDLYDPNDMVIFTCNMGFVINGPRKLTCLDDGEWSGDFPICIPVMCAKPLFVNGRLDEDQDFYAVNEMVKFICDDGFTLVGAKKLTCLKSGDFSGNIPICVRDMCEEPVIENGSFEEDDGDYPVGDMVVFTCDRRYELRGAKKITCRSNSKWSAPFPICEPIVCVRPLVDNGILTPDNAIYFVDNEVKIRCERGFSLMGARKLTCQTDGEFDHPPPVCKPVTCDRPIFENGILDEDKPEYEIHDYVVFICNRGYRLVGASPLKCGIDGEWSDKFPICEPITCDRPFIDNGSLKPSKPFYDVDDYLTFKCDDGYNLKGEETIKCQEDGEWSENFPICKRVTCPVPEIEDGRFEDEQNVYEPDDMVKFFCNRNFFLVGEMKITCLNSGDWSDPFPTCEEYTCAVPVLDNGFFEPIRPAYFLNDEVNFVCNDGYNLDGEKRLTCGPRGQWSDDFPICRPNICRRPSINDGSFSPVQTRYNVDDMVEFECDMGFELSGRRKITCLSSGKWSDDFPVCDAVTCPRPVVSNGVSFSPSQNEYSVRQVVTFKCRRGTTLNGVEEVECLKTGDWSDEFPTCEPNKCVQPEIEDGSFTPFKVEYDVGNKVNFVCDDGFVLVGVEQLRCLTDGDWSNDFPTCERVTCPDPKIRYGSFRPVQATYYYEDAVYFDCNDGFGLVGTARLTCLITGEWSDHFPTCEPNQCEPPQRNPNIISITPSRAAYDIGDEVTFKCRRGFKLVGSETSECQRDQSWSPEEPTCMKIVICRQPTRPRFSTPKPNRPTYEVGEEITYTCRSGFELKGAETIVCQDDGNFDPRPPICQRPPAKCRRPYTPKKLSVDPDKDYYNPGDVIEFECEKPHVLSGDSSSTCLTNGRWSKPIPSCVRGKSDSCKYRCDEDWGYGQPCQCNQYCRYFDKRIRPTYACCDDYTDHCDH